MRDLSDHIARRQVVTQMHADLDAACIKMFHEPPRKHLGASVIGDDCQARAWFGFRWFAQEVLNGQKYRLLNRGHGEEERFVKWLRASGWQVWEHDPDTGKQFRIVGSKGHFGGSLDGIGRPPPHLGIPGDVLLEFKTHGDDSFSKLAGPTVSKWPVIKRDTAKALGVIRSKPVHFKQMCSYGRAYQFKYALYVAVNKNTDEIYFELVELDYRQADDLFRKAEGIVFSRTIPPKIAQVKTFSGCKFCPFIEHCHEGKAPEVNCRSCRHAVPVDGAQWVCEPRGQVIPDNVIATGCPSYSRIA